MASHLRTSNDTSLQEYVDQIISPLLTSSKSHYSMVVSTVLVSFLATYLVGWIQFRHAHGQSTKSKIPPTLPHLIPGLGNIVELWWNRARFTASAGQYLGTQAPCGITLLFNKVYLFQGPNNISTIFKQRAFMNAVFIHTKLLKQLFGMKSNPISMYIKDDSGPYSKPNQHSNIEPRNRIEYLTHEGLVKGLTGPGLAPALKRFSQRMDREIRFMNIEKDWLEFPDTLQFFKEHLTPSLLEALYGRLILTANPDIVQTYWDYDNAIPKLLQWLPRVAIPSAYQARDKMLTSVKRWHAQARRMFCPSSIYEDGDGDPYWGSEMIRSRQRYLLDIDNIDSDAVASADVGLIFASLTSLVPAMTMCFIHAFRDKTLLENLRQELETAFKRDEDIDMEVVERLPRFQSFFSEVLRVYLTAFVTRCAPNQDISINEWRLPKNHVMMLNSYVAHHDPEAWNTKNGLHPLNSFWAERFLIFKDDPTSGPAKRSSEKKPSHDSDMTTRDDEVPAGPKYSIDGLRGSFIPFGGGIRICPGRHYAKRVILWMVATFVSQYDVEICTEGTDLPLDWSVFGLAILRPKDEVPFRIRKRA